jgi:hypothetical protein
MEAPVLQVIVDVPALKVRLVEVVKTQGAPLERVIVELPRVIARTAVLELLIKDAVTE